jgi:hypothetical protein
MSDKLQLIGIQTKDRLYISRAKSNTWYRTGLEEYRFDGKHPEPSYHRDWFGIDKVPTIVEKKVSSERINRRFELKEGFPESEQTPKVVSYEDWYRDDSEGDYYSNYTSVSGLYEEKYDETPETYQEVEFEIKVIDTLDNFQPIVPQYKLEHSLLDEINYHPILLVTRPTRLSCEESYKIVREYVKLNIDKDWATITSDYDFCFTVEKIIILDVPESYRVDVANINNFGSRKRKPRYETRYRKHRKIKIFETAPKPYDKYPVIEPFTGTSYDNLIENINTYLSNLIEMINRPLYDCPHCKGLGIISDVGKETA